MAIKISQKLLSKKGLFFSYKKHPLQTVIFKMKGIIYELHRLFYKKRIMRDLQLYKISPPKSISLGANMDSGDIDHFAQEFNDKKYTFIENFFSQDTFNKLCDSFPHEVFFNYPKNGAKHYLWSDDSRLCINSNKELYREPSLDFLETYPTFKKLYNFLSSDEMSEKVKSITKASEATLYSIALTRAEGGSYLAPHVDSVASQGEIKPGEKVMMNFIYFLLSGGSSPENSGGTGLYLDNEFKTPIYIPSSLRNTALLYDSIEQFYHGFNTMAPGSFRWAIVFQFKIS